MSIVLWICSYISILSRRVNNTQDLFDYLQRTVADTYEWDYFRSEQFTPYIGVIPQLKYYTGQFNWDGNYVNFSSEEKGL